MPAPVGGRFEPTVASGPESAVGRRRSSGAAESEQEGNRAISKRSSEGSEGSGRSGRARRRGGGARVRAREGQGEQRAPPDGAQPAQGLLEAEGAQHHPVQQQLPAKAVGSDSSAGAEGQREAASGGEVCEGEVGGELGAPGASTDVQEEGGMEQLGAREGAVDRASDGAGLSAAVGVSFVAAASQGAAAPMPAPASTRARTLGVRFKSMEKRRHSSSSDGGGGAPHAEQEGRRQQQQQVGKSSRRVNLAVPGESWASVPASLQPSRVMSSAASCQPSRPASAARVGPPLAGLPRHSDSGSWRASLLRRQGDDGEEEAAAGAVLVRRGQAPAPGMMRANVLYNDREEEEEEEEAGDRGVMGVHHAVGVQGGGAVLQRGNAAYQRVPEEGTVPRRLGVLDEDDEEVLIEEDEGESEEEEEAAAGHLGGVGAAGTRVHACVCARVCMWILVCACVVSVRVRVQDKHHNVASQWACTWCTPCWAARGRRMPAQLRVLLQLRSWCNHGVVVWCVVSRLPWSVR